MLSLVFIFCFLFSFLFSHQCLVYIIITEKKKTKKKTTDNPHDNYAVSIIRNSYVAGHVSLGLSKTFSKFLCLPVSTMLCIVTGKRLNRGAGLGLEILEMYQKKGHENALQWLEKTITKIILHADELGSKFKSK